MNKHAKFEHNRRMGSFGGDDFFSKKKQGFLGFLGGEGIIFKNAERHHLENGRKKVCTKFHEATPMGKTSKVQNTIFFEKTRFFGVFLGGRHNFEKR